MVKTATPKAFLIGGTEVYDSAMHEYLTHIGADDWEENLSFDVSDQELLTEVYSRSCYKSFKPGLNPNVTKVRGSNEEHLANIITVNHGSVMEHATTNWMFCDVSRVFTHELVRHRVGTAISQESLRYVRLDDLGQWLPYCLQEIPGAAQVAEIAFRKSEQAYQDLLRLAAEKEGVETFDDLPFNKKKIYTSAARRVAPIGLATNIGWTVNMRELRHVLELRTDPSAEEEMRLIFGRVGQICVDRFPNLFQDFTPVVDGPYTIWQKIAKER